MRKFDKNQFKWGNIPIEDLDDRSVIVNLMITQLLVVFVGFVMILFQKTNKWATLFSFESGWDTLRWGIGYAIAVLLVNMFVSRRVPESVVDDGGINKLLFAKRKIWQIALMCTIVAFSEEILFRGVLQHLLGPYWTSVLFTVIHVRYLRHWLMTGLVFCISYGLGWIYIQTGTLWTPIVAHFLIDFVMGCIIRFRRDR